MADEDRLDPAVPDQRRRRLGDPFARDPERVLADVRNEYVSVAGAARDYGVVVIGDPKSDPEGLRVDVQATAALRNEEEGR